MDSLSKINSGPLFRRFTKGSKFKNRLLKTVALLIKDYLKLAISKTVYNETV